MALEARGNSIEPLLFSRKEMTMPKDLEQQTNDPLDTYDL